MIGISVSIPIACFRKGFAREYLETYDAPPPSTCYGFLLSLVGETERERHIGARVTATSLETPTKSVVLRTVWRVKKKLLGSSENMRPDFQQLLTDVNLILWLDSSEEVNRTEDFLETRVRAALDPKKRGGVSRFGGLSFGESSHLVNEVSIYNPQLTGQEIDSKNPQIFLVDSEGEATLPVWVDHVGSAGTRYVTGTYKHGGLQPPEAATIPKIEPPNV